MGPRRWMAVRDRTRRWWALGAAVATLAALVLVAVTGSREPARAVRLLPGTAWLDDTAIGAVSHVFGYSATAEDPVSIDPAGAALTVVQTPGGGYVLDGRTGILRRLGGTSVGVAAGSALTGGPGDLRVLTTTGATWSADQRSGTAQRLDPDTLVPIGRPVPVGAAFGDLTTDADGDLWAVVPSRGVVVEIEPGGAVQTLAIGRVGDPLQLAATRTGVWAVDGALHELLPLEHRSSDPLPLPDTATTPVVAAAPDSPHVIAVAAGRVTDLDTASDTVTQTTGADLHGVVVGAVADDRAYLLDPVDRRVDILNLDASRIEAAVPVPAGADELIPRDRLVFVNASATPDAAVIDAHDHVTPIVKYRVARGAVPHPVPVPVPDAATTGVVTGGQGTGAGAGAGGGRGAPPSPTRPAPTAPAPVSGPLPGPGDPGPNRPALPVGVVAHLTGTGQIEVAWQAGSDGLPADHYQVQLAPAEATTPMPPEADPTGLRATFRGLSPTATYCPRVQAVSAGGVGSGFQSGGCIGGTAAPTAPPANLKVVPADAGVSVTFDPPPDVAPGTTYTVTVNGTPTAESSAGPHVIAVPVGDGPSVPVTVTVQAGNEGGQGPASQPVMSFAYAPQSPVACLAGTGAVDESLTACSSGFTKFRPQTWQTLPVSGVPVGSMYGDEVLCSSPPAPAGPLTVWATSSSLDGCPVDGGATEPREVVWSQPGATHTTAVVIYHVTVTANRENMDLLCRPSESPATCAGEPVTVVSAGTTYYADPAGGSG